MVLPLIVLIIIVLLGISAFFNRKETNFMPEAYYPHSVLVKPDEIFLLCDYCNEQIEKDDIYVNIKNYNYHATGCVYKFFERIEHEIEILTVKKENQNV